MKWFRFMPQADISAREVAEVLVALAWAVDERVFLKLPEGTRRNFVETEKPKSDK
jgi:hypothetical protein